MNANELMIHNYVSFEGYPVYVTNIGLTYIEGLLCKNGTLYDVKLKHEDVEPIPITEELLLKNGFTYSENRYCGRDLHIYTKKVYGRFLIECTEGFSGDGQYLSNVYELERREERAHTLGNVKYLHQLQNLCNIAGVELQLNIDKI